MNQSGLWHKVRAEQSSAELSTFHKVPANYCLDRGLDFGLAFNSFNSTDVKDVN